jgi:hypothetical protein
MDQVADEGLTGAVVVIGDERTPEYAEQKRKAREQAFKGVLPAKEGGPLSFYNSGAPRKRTRIASEFKTPFLTPSAPASSIPPGAPAFPQAREPLFLAGPSQFTQAGPAPRAQEALFLPGPSQFSQYAEPDTAPPARVPQTSGVPDAEGRQAAIQRLREALRLSFESGSLAEEVLEHWGRSEVGHKR